MARQTGDPSDLIRRLDAALKVAKPKDVVSAEEMAGIVGMTWRNLLKTHIEPDAKFPIRKRGAEGVAWEFQVVGVLKHMLKKARERVAASEERARRIARLTGLNMPDGDNEVVGIHDISKVVDITMRAMALKKEQGAYVPASEVRLYLTGYNRTARDTILGIGKAIDPIGALPPEVTEAIDNSLRELASELESRLQEFTGKWREAVGPRGTA